MQVKTLIPKSTKKIRFLVPISLNWGEKYVLDKLSSEDNLPLSTYIKTKLQPLMKPQLDKLSKTIILLEKIKKAKISDKNVNLSVKSGEQFRKKFKLTSN